MIKFHFLNVGHGDCAFVELPSGRLMMIDINNSQSLPEDDINALAALHNIQASDFRRLGSYQLAKSWEDYYKGLLIDPVDYYRTNFPGKTIFRYVQTHPDMDHMSGIHRFFWQEEIPLMNFWDINHSKEKEEQEFATGPHSYVDWAVYQLLGLGVGPKDSSGNAGEVKVIKNQRFSTGSFWSPDSIEILSPTSELVTDSNTKENWNNASYVLRFEHGGRSVVLAGDAEQAAWDSMLEALPDHKLDCDILKAAHHGRESGYHEDAVNTMAPEVVICSVGKKPESDAHDAYRKHGAEVFSTRSKGTITVTIWDDGEVWVHDAGGNKLKTLPPLLRTN